MSDIFTHPVASWVQVVLEEDDSGVVTCTICKQEFSFGTALGKKEVDQTTNLITIFKDKHFICGAN